jgi:hypothetical protein
VLAAQILDMDLTEAMFSSEEPGIEDVDAAAQAQFNQSHSVILPADLLETASERISMIYKDAIFGEESDDEDLAKGNSVRLLSEETEEKEVEVSIFQGVGMIVCELEIQIQDL